MRAGGEIVYVAVGANLGDREETFASVIRSIELESDLQLLAASSVFETEPLGPEGQPTYLNAALSLRSWLGPIELLGCLQAIESHLGRDRSREVVRWGPRAVDLDIIFFGDRCIQHPDLIVPHPRAHERAFVMAPLAELAPNFCHPVSGTEVAEIAAATMGGGDILIWPRPRGWPAPDRMANQSSADPMD